MPDLGKDTYFVEISRTSEQLAKAGFDPFEHEYPWTERKIRLEIGVWMEMLGLDRKLAHGCQLLSSPRFKEFDSGNPSHSCGFWELKVRFKPKAVTMIERASEPEHDNG